MTSARGTSQQTILCGIALLFAFAVIFSASFVHAALTAGDTGTQTSGNVITSGNLSTGSAGGSQPVNIARSADTFCAQFVYPTGAGAGKCKDVDPKTGKLIGNNCPCNTGKLPDGTIDYGVCVPKNGSGVCAYKSNSASNDNTGSSGKTSSPVPGDIPTTNRGPVSGTSGTGNTGSTNNSGTGSASPPSTSNQGGVTGGNLGNAGTPAGGTSGTQGGTTPTYGGGNSGVLTNTGAWNPGNQSYGTGYGSVRYSGSGGSSAVSVISGFANGIAQIQTFSNGGYQIVPTGSNWSDIARYQNGQFNAYYLAPPVENITINTAGYQTMPSGNYASSSGTFNAQNNSYGDTSADASLKRFIESIRKMSNAAVTGLGDTYRNLTGTSDNASPGSQNDDGSSAYDNAVFDTSIAPDGLLAGQNSVPSYQDSAGSMADMTDLQAARAVAQEVQDDLEELRTTVAMLQDAHENPIEMRTNATPPPIPEKTRINPPPQHQQQTSSSTEREASSSPAAIQSAEATAAIDTAEKKVEQIQSQLDTGQRELSLENDRVQELTAELNALNERIKAGNQALSDPALSRSARFGLLSALLENVQLALSDAETRLEAQTSGSPPPTVGHVVITGFGHAISGAVDVTTQISLSFSQFIEDFWHMLFPAY